MFVTFGWTYAHVQLGDIKNNDNYDTDVGSGFIVSMLAMFVSFALFGVKVKVYCAESGGGSTYAAQENKEDASVI